MIPLAVLLRCRSTPSVWVGSPFRVRDSGVLPGFFPQAYSSWTPPGHRVDRRGQARTGPRLGPAPPALSIRAFVWVDRRTSLRERKVLGASRVTPPLLGWLWNFKHFIFTFFKYILQISSGSPGGHLDPRLLHF